MNFTKMAVLLMTGAIFWPFFQLCHQISHTIIRKSVIFLKNGKKCLKIAIKIPIWGMVLFIETAKIFQTPLVYKERGVDPVLRQPFDPGAI